jgi:NSS family neurotransmitter:Na+ symporter
MIGAAVGLDNIWRYPYIVYSNGGETFLVVYLICILLVAIPLMFLEYSNLVNLRNIPIKLLIFS